MDEKLKSENMQKSSFLCLCYILRAIRAGRCRERRYAEHIFIQICFRMHHFVVKFSSPQAARGHWPPNQTPADVPGCNLVKYAPLAIELNKHRLLCSVSENWALALVLNTVAASYLFVTMQMFNRKLETCKTSDQNNLTDDRIAAAHGSFNRISQVAPMCTPRLRHG